MSERPPMQPPPEAFSHYWGWMAKQPNSEELFRLITTTPGLPDVSTSVADVEKATKELLHGRMEALRELLSGYEILDNGMNRDIATAIFNEFAAGSRTLLDFETRNFSKKNKAGPRESFPSTLSGNPMAMNARVEELKASGYLPTTPFIYSSQCEEFFTQVATNMYYDQIFGEAQIFFNILKKYSHNPNHPPGVHPLPYHPGMNVANYYELFPGYSTFRQSPYPMYQQQMQPMEYTGQHQQQQPVYYPVMAPQFYPVAMQMQPPLQQPVVIYQQNYQQPDYPPQNNGNGVAKFNKNGKGRKSGKNESLQYQQQYHPQYQGQYQQSYHMPVYQPTYQPMEYQSNGNRPVYDNANTASSSSSSTANKSVASESQEAKTEKANRKLEKASSASEEQSTSTAKSTTPATAATVTEPEPKPLPEMETTTSKDSTPSDKTSEEQVPTPSAPEVVEAAKVVEAPVLSETETALTVDVHLTAPSSPPVTATMVVSTPRKFSDVVAQSVSHSTSGSVSSTGPSEDVAAVIAEEKVEIKKKEKRQKKQAKVEPKEESEKKTLNVVKEATAPATTALVVDTTEKESPVLAPVSVKTLAEVVQQSLSAAPSPVVNGSAQPSPAVKPYAATASPANESAPTKQTSQRKQPSVSYAQMLYNSPKTGPSSTSSRSSGSSTTAPAKPTPKVNGTDWQTVKNKKAAEPATLSPSFEEKPVKPVVQTKPVAKVQVDSDDDEVLKSDDPDLEKKRERRRQKRQRIKEVNKQQKQNEKEIARQESLARVKTMNGDAPIQPTAAPAFDRNNLAARRRKRQELQRKAEQGNTSAQQQSPDPPLLPIIPIRQLNGTPMSTASINAGHTAMAALSGLTTGQFRRPSPFALVAPGTGHHSLPLYLPPQPRGGEMDGMRIEDVPEELIAVVNHARLSRKVEENGPPAKRSETEENAVMIERILMFDSLEKLLNLEVPENDKASIAKGLDDVKKMYVRVEKAGKLIAYKQGSSKVPQKTEEKLLALTVKLLSNRVELSPVDNQAAEEISQKVAGLSKDFHYTNFLSALVDYSENRAKELPDGTSLRKNYEQTVVLTKVFLKRTKTVFEKIEKHFDFRSLEE